MSTSWRKPADWFHLDRSKQLFEPNRETLERLKDITKRIDDME